MLGLYVHIPFCRRKCPYCDFYSVEASTADRTDYPALLIQHLKLAKQQGWCGPVATVYFGGGTPSLLPTAAIAQFLHEVDQHFGLTPDAEITLEGNPGTLDAAGLAGLRSAGVNRLSLGLQTLDAQQLVRLGRLHDRQAGLDAVRHARAAGFTNLSLDLMFALPGQTQADLAEDLRQYIDLAPEHLSCYGLTAEPGTLFAAQVAQGALELPDADHYADAYQQIHDSLAAAGYRHYEIANFARDGASCRHNRGYWARRPYLGLGAGAHSFAADTWGRRTAVPPDLADYARALRAGRDPAEEIEVFDRKGALSETVYLALRTADGIEDQGLRDQFDTDLERAFPEAVEYLAPWLHKAGDHWSLTLSGWLLYDRLIQEFL